MNLKFKKQKYIHLKKGHVYEHCLR